MELTEEQQKAAQARQEVVIVRAGPGAGKTRVLIARVNRLLETMSADNLLVVTFTRSAAAEINARIGEVVATTIHAWCASYCRRHANDLGIPNNFTVQDDVESRDLALAVGAELGFKWKTAKRILREPAAQDRYDRRKRESGRLDYDDLITLALDHVRGAWPPYSHVLVDEAQDTTVEEQALLGSLGQVLFMVGDPSQSLYSFRGASPNGFASMRGHHMTLRGNFRSGRAIVAAAQRLQLDPPPVAQVCRCAAPEGLVAALPWEELARDIPPTGLGECAVLAPTWRDAEQALEELAAVGIAAVMGRRESMWRSHPQARQVLSVLRLLAYPMDRVAAECLLGDDAVSPAWRRAVAQGAADSLNYLEIAAVADLPGHGPLFWALQALRGGRSLQEAMALVAVLMELPEEMREQLRAGAAACEGPAELVTLLLDEDARMEDQGDRVMVTTIHQAKGREWDHVWVLGCGDRPMWGGEMDARRRLYVAATRARETCTLVHRGPLGSLAGELL